MRKILFVVNVDWFFLSHRVAIALAAIDNGYEVHLATNITDKLEQLQRYGFIVHPLNLGRSDIGISSAIRAFLQIYKVFKVVLPDVVHLVTIKPVLLGGIAARIAGIPSVVFSISGLGYFFVSNGIRASVRRWIIGCLYRLAFSSGNHITIFQNTDDRDVITKITGLAPANVEMIPGSGVDLSLYKPRPNDSGAFVVMLVSRLLKDKGVYEFMQAARILSGLREQDNNSCRFVLVGNPDPGNPTSLSQSQLDIWEQQGVAEFWGYREDIPGVLSSASVVVLPSYREGFPKILIEAAACGRAIITTDVPGCRDAIETGVTGLLVPAHEPEALARAILTLYNNPTLCSAMGSAGRERAENLFDIRQVVATHLRIYQGLVEKANH